MFKDIIYSAPVLTALSSVIVSASVYCFMSGKKFIDRKVDHRFRLKIDERERSIGLITNLVEFAVSEGAQVLSGAKYSGEKIGKTDQVRKRSLTFVQHRSMRNRRPLM